MIEQQIYVRTLRFIVFNLNGVGFGAFNSCIAGRSPQHAIEIIFHNYFRIFRHSELLNIKDILIRY